MALLAVEVLELGRRPDVVRGELDELVGRQVAPARGRRRGRRSRASRARRSHGRTRSARVASYQQSPARMTSTSGGSSSSTSRRTTVTRPPLARALSSIAAAAKASMSAAVASTRTRAQRRDRAQPGTGREIEDPTPGHGLRVLAQVPRDRQPTRPRERPVGERGVRIVGLDLDRVPQRQHLVGQVEADRLQPGHGPEPRVTEDERALTGHGQAHPAATSSTNAPTTDQQRSGASSQGKWPTPSMTSRRPTPDGARQRSRGTHPAE